MATTAANTGSDLNLDHVLEEVAKEKGIEKQSLVETIEAAIVKAAQSAFGPSRELEARYNPDTGQVDLFQYLTVVEEVKDSEREICVDDVKRLKLGAELGEELGFQIFWREEDKAKAKQQDKEYGDLLGLRQARTSFGRIAAQTAKQVLLQRVRDAERDIIYNEFQSKKGELIRGIVRRFERGNNIIVDLTRTEAVLPAREQTPRETYRPGERIVAYVKDVDREARGPIVILSRSDPRLVDKLFEAEVPEIYEGIVRIVAVAREAGSRSKIAVTSRDADVDPVGACVGMKGSRVQAVVQELRGEKIDIVPYDRDPARYVIAAIQPAEVTKVVVDDSAGRMEIVVPDEKLSLAIGRKGQNVRLASQLTDWKLDVISDSKFRKMEEEAIAVLERIDGVSDALARAMYRTGFRALEELAEATPEELTSIPGIGDQEAAQKLQRQAATAMEQVRKERIRELALREEPPTERERLACVPGVSPRVLTLLEEAGYKTVAAVLKENEDKLGIRTGLGFKKATATKDAIAEYIRTERETFQAMRAVAAEELAASASDEAAAAEPSSEPATDSAEPTEAPNEETAS